MLARAIERCGISTVQLASIRSYVERLTPPRALYCEFPLGRPLGKPLDPEYQLRVLRAAFSLLDREAVPVLEQFPDRIEDASHIPLACPVPAAYHPGLPPAVEEARALLPAYLRQLRRTGRTSVGRVVLAQEVPDAVASMVRIADGEGLDEVPMAGAPGQVARDIQAYYEEAAAALANTGVEARQAESWFYRNTKAGAALLRAQVALRDAGLPEPVWRFMVPSTQGGR